MIKIKVSASKKILRYLGLVFLLLWCGFPLLIMFISSLKSPIEIFSYPPSFIFRPTLNNFVKLFTEYPQILFGIKNSLIVTICTAFFTALLATPAGYGMSRGMGKIFSVSSFFMLLIRMYPPIVITIPLFPVFSRFGLTNIWGLVILYTTFFISLSSMLMKTFIDDIPVEIEEAAEIDGANLLNKIFYIILPLCKQGIITSTVFVVIFAWKEFTFAFIFAGSSSRTAPIVLHQLQDAISGVQWGALFAGAVFQIFPLIIFMLVLQGYLIEGLSRTGLKA